MTATVLGVDIGGTHIRALSEEAGSRSAMTQTGVEKTFDGLADQIVGFITDHGATSVGISLPGRVANNRPRWIPNLPFLEKGDLVSTIKERVNAQVTLTNDAHSALLAECVEGAAIGCRDVVLVTIGTGIGGAILLDGKPLLGHTGTAGSFGWMPSALNERGENPREIGPWETRASGTALLSLVSPWGSVEAFIDRLAEGDEESQEIVDQFSRELAPGFASLASVIDPEKIVVVGGVSALFPHILGVLVREVQTLASPTGRRVPIVVGELGPSASTIGALHIGRGAAA